MENYHDNYIDRLVEELDFEHGKAEDYAVVFYALFTEHDVPVEELDEIYDIAESRLSVHDIDFSKSVKVGVMRAIERIRK